MGTAIKQYAQHIIRPALEQIGLHSPAAEQLLVGTVMAESGFSYLRQLDGGPALGYYQIEPDTHDDLWRNWLVQPKYSDLRHELYGLLTMDAAVAAMDVDAAYPAHDQLVVNPLYATAIARCIYYRRPEPLPAAGDIDGLARYWKQFYNTANGAGTESHFKAAIKGAL